jgi:hypothetical protein
MRTLYTIPLLLIISGFFSCKKLDYDAKFTTFGDIFFLNNSVNTDLEVKYGGSPIAWDKGSGKIHTIQGEGIFEFYDKISGVSLGSKKVNILGKPETFMIFQPLKDVPISFLDPAAQANEPVPDQGFIKIKIANYLKSLIPLEKVDIVFNTRVRQGRAYIYTPAFTIEGVTQSLDKEVYHSIPEPPSTSVGGYWLSFIDHDTKANLLTNVGGQTAYSNSGITDYASKGIYTIYLSTTTYDFSNILYIEKNGIYYAIYPNVLFAD